MFSGIGPNSTILNLVLHGANFSMKLFIKGVISNPSLRGNEESYLKLTNVIHIWLPLNTYLDLANKTKLNLFNVLVNDYIYVKVKEGYKVSDVVENIKKEIVAKLNITSDKILIKNKKASEFLKEDLNVEKISELLPQKTIFDNEKK